MSKSLFQRVKAINDWIPTDGIGGSPLDKCFVMACLTQKLKLRNYVEIGVYRGKSLFSVAPAFVENGGALYGIDPWRGDTLKETELSDELKAMVDHFADTADFEALYQEVLARRKALGLDGAVILLRQTAEAASAFFRELAVEQGFSIDMLHIDGNHDESMVRLDIETYYPLVSTGGVIVFDDIDWSGVRKVYDKYRETCFVLMETDQYGILLKTGGGLDAETLADIQLLRQKLPFAAQLAGWGQEGQRPETPHDLLIIDDVYPSEYSPFRREEFSRILTHIKDTVILTTGDNITMLKDDLDAETMVDNFDREDPECSQRVRLWHREDGLEGLSFKLAYFTFLQNVYPYIELLEEEHIPFVFELYPGGGFALDDPKSDERLERVLRSPCFRKVIVTQDLTHEYLLKKGWCGEDEIVDLFGVVMSREILENARLVERAADSRMTVGFCAYKYTPTGRDKGYDIFVDTAKMLHKRFPDFRFQVTGPYDETVLDVSELGGSIEFLGVLSEGDLSRAFRNIDILVAPHRSNVIGKGFFDGFPTSSCVTAALNGALVMTTDEFGLNNGRFTLGEDLDILPPDPEAFFQRIVHYHNNRKHFQRVRRNGLDLMQKLYSEEVQIIPRIRLLQDEIGRSEREGRPQGSYPRPDRISIPIMHCFDNNYVIPAAASFYSMLKYANPQYNYKLYVLHTDITSQNRQLLQQVVASFKNASLEFINMEDRFEEIWDEFNFSVHLSKEVLYKLLLPSIFPQYEKMIVTDVDVVFCGDIAPSYFSVEADEAVCFAGVRQVCPKGSWLESYYTNYTRHFGRGTLDKLKICGGYLVANLRYMRQQDKETQFLDCLAENAYRLLQAEQDVINFCCQESEIKYLPLDNVVCSYIYDLFPEDTPWPEDPFYSKSEIREAMEHPIQLHYATGIKPWKDPLSTKAEQWVRYLAESGAYPTYMKKQTYALQPSPERVDNASLGNGWSLNASPITVSVLCCTYNHEAFIRETLDAIIGQEVSFPFEVIVADDASTDQTAQIIREYAEKYPKLIRPILREKNVGIGENYYDALRHVNGKYLAICDGDDVWIEPTKLQQQVRYLDSHEECNICCTSFVRQEWDEEKGAYVESLFKVHDYVGPIRGVKRYYTFSDLLYCRFISSCTVMLRWQFLQRVPEFLRCYRTIDFPLSLLHAAGGYIGVLNDLISATYRVHSQGLTSAKDYHMRRECQMILTEVDQYLDYRFTQSITQFIKFSVDMNQLESQQPAESPPAVVESGEAPAVQRSRISMKERLNRMKWKTYAFFRQIYLDYMPESVHTAYRKLKAKLRKR